MLNAFWPKVSILDNQKYSFLDEILLQSVQSKDEALQALMQVKENPIYWFGVEWIDGTINE